MAPSPEEEAAKAKGEQSSDAGADATAASAAPEENPGDSAAAATNDGTLPVDKDAPSKQEDDNAAGGPESGDTVAASKEREIVTPHLHDILLGRGKVSSKALDVLEIFLR